MNNIKNILGRQHSPDAKAAKPYELSGKIPSGTKACIICNLPIVYQEMQRIGVWETFKHGIQLTKHAFCQTVYEDFTNCFFRIGDPVAYAIYWLRILATPEKDPSIPEHIISGWKEKYAGLYREDMEIIIPKGKEHDEGL